MNYFLLNSTCNFIKEIQEFPEQRDLFLSNQTWLIQIKLQTSVLFCFKNSRSTTNQQYVDITAAVNMESLQTLRLIESNGYD